MQQLETIQIQTERQFERDFDTINDVKFKEVMMQAQDFLNEINDTTPTMDKHMTGTELRSYAQN